jgi:antitoxin PrlF
METFLTSCSESTVTGLYQTTIPEPIRKALGLSQYDTISYCIQPNGHVLLSRVAQPEHDSILKTFLTGLAQEMEDPQNHHILDAEQTKRVKALVADEPVEQDERWDQRWDEDEDEIAMNINDYLDNLDLNYSE